ncbi:MAG TPA: hypothetical protein VK506_14770 [Conexibacter sp.]|nr:hypothetical protein [Conexibacter sp.]
MGRPPAIAGGAKTRHSHARAWWERLGFHPFHPDDPTDTDLYLLTSEIEATLDPLGQ